MLSDRLKTAMERAGLSQADLARACNVSAPSVNGWLSGKSKFLRGENLLSAAKALGVSQQWLANGLGPMAQSSPIEIDLETHPDLTAIPTVMLKLKASVDGFAVEADMSRRDPVFFRTTWLRSRGFNAKNLLSIRVHGSSMENSLYDGDSVLINTADVEPRDGEVFAVNYEGEPVVKRLMRDGGKWWLSSDNPDKVRYPSKECAGDACILVGRVVHKQSERI